MRQINPSIAIAFGIVIGAAFGAIVIGPAVPSETGRRWVEVYGGVLGALATLLGALLALTAAWWTVRSLKRQLRILRKESAATAATNLRSMAEELESEIDAMRDFKSVADRVRVSASKPMTEYRWVLLRNDVAKLRPAITSYAARLKRDLQRHAGGDDATMAVDRANMMKALNRFSAAMLAVEKSPAPGDGAGKARAFVGAYATYLSFSRYFEERCHKKIETIWLQVRDFERRATS